MVLSVIRKAIIENMSMSCGSRKTVHYVYTEGCDVDFHAGKTLVVMLGLHTGHEKKNSYFKNSLLCIPNRYILDMLIVQEQYS